MADARLLPTLAQAADLDPGVMTDLSSPLWMRLLMILAVAVGAHMFVRLVSWYSRSLLRSRFTQSDKPRTLIQFTVSLIVFLVYFVAVGFILYQLNVDLKTYIASATVIGLAVSFGSQLLVQDVIAGLTLIFADLIDVGDMVDIGGQIGIVNSVGVRYTTLHSFAGAEVRIPNRNVANVIRYPDGFTRVYLDIHIPVDNDQQFIAAIDGVCRASAAQFPGAILLPPDLARSDPAAAGSNYDVVRAKFRIWPGQSALIGGAVRAAVLAALREIDPDYADWRVTMVERSEMKEAGQSLPAPSEVLRRRRQQTGPGQTGTGETR